MVFNSSEANESSAVGKQLSGKALIKRPGGDVEGYTHDIADNAEIFNDYDDRTYEEDSSKVLTGNVAIGSMSHAEGHATTAYGDYSHAEGTHSFAGSSGSHAEGDSCYAAFFNAHAEGCNTKVSGNASHVEGWTNTCDGSYSHVEGSNNLSEAPNTHVDGNYCKTLGNGASMSNVGGYSCTAYGYCSFIHGSNLMGNTDYITIFGRNSVRPSESKRVTSTASDSALLIGNGLNGNFSNAFRITYEGKIFGASAFNSSGADYAEMFEWSDGNPNNDDRIGRFVTLNGEKISLASYSDTDILGVISGSPTVLGDIYDDQWKGMYMTDVFGRYIYEYVDTPPEIDSYGEEVSPSRTNYTMKISPDYDSSATYIPRSQRQEWDAVGLLGKLVMLDDGTAEVNGYVRSADGGIATKSEERTKFRVMARLDENHIKILIL